MGANHWGGKPDPEKLDPRPREMPLGACKPETLSDTIARFVAAELAAQTPGDPESFEEADNFEEEDPDTLDFSPYEFAEIQDDYLEEVPAEPPPPLQETGPEPDPSEPAPAESETPSEVSG
jgi:hypothetical protein